MQAQPPRPVHPHQARLGEAVCPNPGCGVGRIPMPLPSPQMRSAGQMWEEAAPASLLESGGKMAKLKGGGQSGARWASAPAEGAVVGDAA